MAQPPLPPVPSDPTDLGFSHHVRKSGDVDIQHHGRLAATLRGAPAAAFLAAVQAGTPADAQQRMARLTGNYKRGNERQATGHARNRG
jgi:hypothetical protein